MALRLEELFIRYPMLKDRLNERAGSLSGGQQKLLEFARVFLQKPRLLMVDEPGIGLAPDVAETIYQLITELAASGMTILIVDRDIRRLMKMSSQLYVLNLGKLTEASIDDRLNSDIHSLVKKCTGISTNTLIMPVSSS